MRCPLLDVGLGYRLRRVLVDLEQSQLRTLESRAERVPGEERVCRRVRAEHEPMGLSGVVDRELGELWAVLGERGEEGMHLRWCTISMTFT